MTTQMTAPPDGPRLATSTGPPALLNRHREREALDGLLAGAHAGADGSLVLRGESGIGKTALIGYAEERATDMRVVRLAGIEPEMGLGYAALHRLLIPFLPRLIHLPEPQRDALRHALGQVATDTPDRFLVGLGVLGLLADAADARPLLATVDDAQWLDEATTDVLAFVAHRLGAERIAVVAAVREPTARCRPLDGLPDLYLTGLPDGYARQLLAAVVAGPLDERVAERIVAETSGNPLALVEFGRVMTDDQHAAGTPLPQPLPIGARR
jgi:predicted ATPase